VLDAPARRLLDRVAPDVARASRAASASRSSSRPRRRPVIADVGTGTGALGVACAERWPEALVVGVDPSRGMLERARARGERVDGAGSRLRWLTGPAEALPLDDGSVDVAVSSFVLQLVDDRQRALAEVRRVLRPGGRFAFVTWLDRGPAFPPAEEFDEAVVDVGIEEPEPPPEPSRAGDYRSLRAAERELRAAGLRRVGVRSERLEHRWVPADYLAFKLAYDERALFAWLDEGAAARLVERVRVRWSKLALDDFTFRAELVSATATRA
jgi:SAM-dependent methyltransferase